MSKSKDISKKSRTTPIKSSMRTIPKYPETLSIYKIPASRYWNVRCYMGGKLIRKSTKTEDEQEAKKYAKNFYNDLLLRSDKNLPLVNSSNFEKFAELMLEKQQKKIDAGERNEKLNLNDRQKLKKDILPFFRKYDIKNITYKDIDEYISQLSQKQLAQATKKAHLNVIRKVLNTAHQERVVNQLPPFPKIESKDNSRGWFNETEYEHLKKTVQQLIKEKRYAELPNKKRLFITDEMRYLITFMTNTLLRPSEVKDLRHRNIQIIEREFRYLRITKEKSKTRKIKPVVSQEAAVDIYKDIQKYHRNYSQDDFVFLPKVLNRTTAMREMGVMFNFILQQAKLKKSVTGENRTLYCLRHTGISLRILKGDNVNLKLLADNAGTSVEMIDRFYASKLEPEMRVEEIQSYRPSLRKTPKKSVKN